MLSNWSISPNGSLLHQQKELFSSSLNIVHLDDHSVFSGGVQQILTAFFGQVNISVIRDGDIALAYFEAHTAESARPVLFLTDINHPGLRGQLLLKQLRAMEKAKGLSRIPVIVLSMLGPEHLPEYSRPGNEYADFWFCKSVDPDILIDAVETLLARSVQ